MRYLTVEIGKINCPKHGKVASKVFVVTEPNEGVLAHYECFHCWHAAGEPKISKTSCAAVSQ